MTVCSGGLLLRLRGVSETLNDMPPFTALPPFAMQRIDARPACYFTYFVLLQLVRIERYGPGYKVSEYVASKS